ncbi:helix-turn-helix domain-containing protein [Ferruginibacter sp.]|uniref:helix-turn-helix domain-containing protein n=1 Tax=Ferruginibacter sp. TaxID=1940288 RepID=UPI001997BFCA|nr:helix-turn-helix transcriptional regulator [Ferruginibacter sp.]MBC7628099.1 helix-turn-helix transcriptional regulator [Ferruginibacter sp.]
MDIKIAIGERIAELRKAKNLSQQQFAYEAEIERSYLSHLEKGRKNISVDMLMKITTALNVSVKEFFKPEVFNNK